MTKAERQQRNAALMALVELANGYGMATPAQILEVATRFDLTRCELEGLYFDATETAGDE